jgi:hypothetical protein
MFCLEELQNEKAENPIGCRCHYSSHGSCLQKWFEEKNQYECPICHCISVPNPMLHQDPVQPIYHTIYIEHIPQGRIHNCEKKTFLFMCLIFLFTYCITRLINGLT